MASPNSLKLSKLPTYGTEGRFGVLDLSQDLASRVPDGFGIKAAQALAGLKKIERRGCTPVSFVLNEHQAFDLRGLEAHGHRLSNAG